MMEMDDRDSAKCRKSKLRDKMVIIVNDTKDERAYSDSYSPLIGDKKGKNGEDLQ